MNYFSKNDYLNKQYKTRLSTDKQFEAFNTNIKTSGLVKKALDFVIKHQLTNDELWKMFVGQFKSQPDSDGERWRGEYFGKMMRGGVFVYKVTKSKNLYKSLKNAVVDLLKVQDEDGRISSYKRTYEFVGWDMWCRKYVMLGLEYFLEICDDNELRKKITTCLIKQADYILNHVGKEEGKIGILDTSLAWGCVNSCTILEPMVKLYNLTNEQRYLDFANYIKDQGGCNIGNLIELALENIKFPYEYPTTKAYEMMSFFEGVIELYSVTHEEKLKTAFFNFVEKVINSEFSIIGCGGCTHELFDNSSITQTNVQTDVVQETCVTVTMMKMFTRALQLSDNPKYADCIEISYYNAMMGSINFNKNDELYWGTEYTEKFDYSFSAAFVKKIKGLTFDAYAPLYKYARNKKTGGYNLVDGCKCYGCCSCIGSLGVANLPLYAVMLNEDGLTINHYFGLSEKLISNQGNTIQVTMKTAYPYGNTVNVNIKVSKEERFKVKFRIPSYVKNAKVNNVNVKPGEYYVVDQEWSNNNIDILFEFNLEAITLNDKVALRNGIIAYAIDDKIEDINSIVSSNIVNYQHIKHDIKCNDELLVTFDNNKTIKVVDYSSSGQNWYRDTNKVTVWMDK